MQPETLLPDDDQRFRTAARDADADSRATDATAADPLNGGERWKLWNGRLLPYWYFGVAFFAALGLGAAVMWLSRRLPSRLHMHWPRALVVLGFAVATGLVIDSTEPADQEEITTYVSEECGVELPDI